MHVSGNAPASAPYCVSTELILKLPALLHRKFWFFPHLSSLQLLILDIYLNAFLKYVEVFVGSRICDFSEEHKKIKIANSLRNQIPTFPRIICKSKPKLLFTLRKCVAVLSSSNVYLRYSST